MVDVCEFYCNSVLLARGPNVPKVRLKKFLIALFTKLIAINRLILLDDIMNYKAAKGSTILIIIVYLACLRIQ